MLLTRLNGPDHEYRPSLAAALLASFLIQPGLTTFADAQASPTITSSGLSTTVTKSGNQFDITGGTRPGSGPNLFHSFGEFGLPTDNVANFLNETAFPTSNILGRVTGGNPSNIFGTIQTTGFGSANLFLMNPAGIVFGPNAALNVGGSVSFTTADYLRLTDGARFNALPGPADAAISAAPVAAFGFLGSNPGAITVQGGQLAVSEGQTLSVVGGDLTLAGETLADGATQSARLAAPGGQINLVGVASAGEVVTSEAGPPSTHPMPNRLTSYGQVSLAQKASIDTSGDRAGRIVLRGGRLTMDDASLKAITMDGQGAGPVGATGSPGISVTAETVALNNGTLITADTRGSSPAGDITFSVDTLTTKAGVNRVLLNPPIDDGTLNGNLIASDSRSTEASGGAAGRITLHGVGGPGTAAANVVLEDISISNRIFGGTAQTVPSRITITADSLLFTNRVLPDETGAGGATIVATTIGAAPAGDIALHVNTMRVNVHPDETPIAGARRVFINTTNDVGRTAGPAGRLMISGLGPESTDAAESVALYNAQLSSGVDGGTPATPPGVILITADTVSLSGRTVFFANTFGDVTAPAGSIAFNVNQLRANVKADGTLINGQRPSSINSSSPAWQAGTLTVSGTGPEITDAATLIALNNIEFTTAVGRGTASTTPATIMMTADTMQLTNSVLKTDTAGAAPAGNIVLTAAGFQADQSARISSTSSGTGPGGSIALTAGQSVSLSDGSMVSAGSTGAGNAGNIAIDAGGHFLSRNASILTEATHASGGNIVIQATDSIRLVNSQLSTSVQGGPTTSGGNILLDPAVVTLQNSQVLAQAVQGQGGNINIIAGTFLADQTSIVNASSQFGLSGTVDIQSPLSNLSGTLATLPQRPLQIQHLMQQRCAAQAQGHFSSLVVAGRDALPAEPGGWLLSPPVHVAERTATPEGQAVAWDSVGVAHQRHVFIGPEPERTAPRPPHNFVNRTAGCRS